MIHCYEKEQSTKEQKQIVPDTLVSPRINEGHLRGGAREDYFCFYGWDTPCIANISISCFRNVLSGYILPWILQAGISKLVWERSQMFYWKVRNLFPKWNVHHLTLYIQNFHFEQRNHDIIKEISLAIKLKISISRERKFWFAEKFNCIHPWK